jgi:hypothetical protein
MTTAYEKPEGECDSCAMIEQVQARYNVHMHHTFVYSDF